MQVFCEIGHEFSIDDPADEGWEYTSTESLQPETITYADGSTDQIQRTVRTPIARHLVAKCNASTPTDENPTAMCGRLVRVVQSIESE